MVSKAALRSKRMKSVTVLLSILIQMSFWTFNRAVSVKWYLRKPFWNLGRGAFFHSGREVVEVQPFPLPWKWMEDYWLDGNFHRPNQVQVFSLEERQRRFFNFLERDHWEERDLPSRSIGGANTSGQDFSSHVGTGSSRQGALEDSRTILDTSSTDSTEKLSRFSLGVTGTSLGSWTWNLPRFSFMISIFLRKEVPNSFSSFVGSVCSGRAVSSGSLHKELTTRNNLRESPAHWSIRVQ